MTDLDRLDAPTTERYSLEPYATDALVPDPEGEWTRYDASLVAENKALREAVEAVVEEWDAALLNLVGQSRPVARPSDLARVADAILPLRAALHHKDGASDE